MSRSSFLITAVAVLAVLMCSSILAQTDSIWIESMTANPGGVYSVSMNCQIYQDIGSIEVPLITTDEALVFDTVTSDGSIIPPEMIIGGIIKDEGNRILISFIPAFPLNPIEPPGGKLCDIHFHIKPNSENQTIVIDTLKDTIYLEPLTITWLRGWGTDGITQIPLAFGSANIEVVSGGKCGDANDDGNVNVTDALWIINYIFVGGDPPVQFYLADVNVDDIVNITDAVYLINYIFRGGSEPCAD